jgi:hypothetical protein
VVLSVPPPAGGKPMSYADYVRGHEPVDGVA